MRGTVRKTPPPDARLALAATHMAMRDLGPWLAEVCGARMPDASQSSWMASAIRSFATRMPLLLDRLDVLPHPRHRYLCTVPFRFLKLPYFPTLPPQYLHTT